MKKFTPMDVDPPLYIRVHQKKTGNDWDALIFLSFIVGMIILFLSL